jgi:hypothetical protein
MQEHIRRAHPEHYVPKLPATEESFLLMINTPPSDRHTSDTSPASAVKGLHDRRSYHHDDMSNPGTPRHSDDISSNPLIGAANAAAALAELHGIKSDRDSIDGVCHFVPPAPRRAYR